MKIKQNIEYGLQGQFKVDIYDRQGDLIDTTDYFTNFITQTGLNYPLVYNFADCFRYLTLGRNGGPNTMSVTGLLPVATPVTALVKDYDDDSISYQNWEYLGDAQLDKKSNSSAGSCGTIVGADGPSYYRGWKLPTGDNVFTEGQASISEFMVSPSTGLDLTGRFAFSRIPRNVIIPSGTRTIVTYMLNVKIKHTGINYFHSGTFNTGAAEVSEQRDLVESFGSLSGYYRQCYHGLRCIDNQGRTFIPKYGDPMEPSQVRLDSLAIYFSPDNSQFDVNRHGGGQSNVKSSYATDGLIALSFNHDLAANANVAEEDIHNNAKMDLSDLPSDNSSPFEHHKNIRLNASASERPPRLANYTVPTDQTVNLEDSIYDYLENGEKGVSAISMATMGSALHRPAEFDRGFKTAFSSMMSNLGVDMAKFTGRRRNLVRKAFITPINALGHNSRFGSLVYAYKNGSSYWPAVDCMFFDNSGRSVQQHYRVFSGCYMTERGRGIIKSTLTTDPSTLGGFNVETIHGPIVYDSNFGTSDITGHSGFYADQLSWNDDTYQYDIVKGVGVRISGEIAPTYTVPGSTGTYTCDGGNCSPYAGMVDVGGIKYYGWGAIQGHLAPTAFDYGIVDHRIEIKGKVPSTHPNYDNQHPDKLQTVVTPIQTPPNTYGVDGKGFEFSIDDLYWPNVMGSKLNLEVNDLTYYDVGVGVLPDPAGYFTATNQIVADITFKTDLSTFTVDPDDQINYLPLISVTQNHSNSNQACGFFLSRNTGWLEVDHHGNTAGTWSTSTKYAKGAIVDDGTGICSITAYSTEATCIANGACSDGTCSDTQYTTESTCVADGICSDPQYTNKTDCEAAGGGTTWTPTNTWTEYTTQSTCVAQGTCSAGGWPDQASCELASEIWTPFTWTAGEWSEPTSVAAGANLYRSLIDDNDKAVPVLHVAKWEQISVIPYDGRQLNMGWDNAGTFVSTEAATEMRDQMKNLSDQAVTGYLVPSVHVANGDITNTTWVGNVANFPPANSVRVPVQSGSPSFDIYVGPSQAAYQIKAGQPNQLFDGWQAIGTDGLGACMDASNVAATTADNDDVCFPTKATNMVSRLSGQNVGPSDGPSYALVFTGCDSKAGASKPSNPVYVIAGRASNLGGDFDWSVNAAYTGAVRVSDFLSPVGYFIHYESPRLLPNFATGQASTDAYPMSQIKQGGVYPGMSNLNTLEVYMDISWSAPCAGVVGCVEQEA